uniref:SH3 domain-containing protein n=1 Tax=Desulfovibrio sp. U5L TaxID=596152 RepID=I2Q5R0_9BACT
MRRAWLVALAVAWLWAGVVGAAWAAGAAGPGETLLAAGRQAYAAGRYAEAATAFAEAAAAEPGRADAALCLDAAMAWRLAGQTGRAAYWLYRGQAVAPADPEVKKALAAAGLTPLSAGLPLGALVAPRLLWLAALAANAVFWLSQACSRLLARPLPRPAVALGAALVLWLWCEAAWPAVASRLAPRGVVLAEVPAQSAPEAGAEALFSLPAGALVELGPHRGGFVRVMTASGGTGWAVRDRIAILLP